MLNMRLFEKVKHKVFELYEWRDTECLGLGCSSSLVFGLPWKKVYTTVFFSVCVTQCQGGGEVG